MSHPTGGAAFPQPIHHPDLDVYAGSGMTLRDYFAAKILAAWIIASPILSAENEEHRSELARLSYLQADAMLAARVKP